MEEKDLKNINIDKVDSDVQDATALEEQSAAVENATEAENVQATDDTQEKEGKEDKVEYVYKEMSPLRMVGRRFFRSKLSIVGLVMIVFLILFSFLGPVIYDKWGEETVDRTEVINTIRNSYDWVDENGETITIKEVLQHKSEINSYADPSKDHLLGTDDKGMDVFVRIMYG